MSDLPTIRALIVALGAALAWAAIEWALCLPRPTHTCCQVCATFDELDPQLRPDPSGDRT